MKFTSPDIFGPIRAWTRQALNGGHAFRPTGIVGRFVRFLFTGGSAAVVDLACFMLLVATTGQVFLAAVISFLVAITYNFLISSRFAFDSNWGWQRYAVFVTGACMGLVINVGVTMQAVATGSVPLALAKILGIGVAFVFNFLFHHFVTFAARRPSTATNSASTWSAAGRKRSTETARSSASRPSSIV